MYSAPVDDILFSLLHEAGLADALAAGRFPGLARDDIAPILGEAGRFAAERLAPLDRGGDRAGVTLTDGVVTTAPGWREAYADWAAAGWNCIAAPESAGGQGLPLALSAATQEIWNGASMAFALCPMLTMGAVEALAAHGSEALKALYLPKMVAGAWTATMNLTEPQAGSDLGALATRAERRNDGTYRLFGQKIFITYGEHDLAENIVHLVLARLPDAPAGSRGISLFLAPKFIPGEDGRPALRNNLVCAGIEHKLGIHASPTCTMIYGDGGEGATAWLVGEEHRGLACMFTMMNNARLMVGVQGVGQAERALQLASAYAAERRQGRAPGHDGPGMSPIAAHPDVARMLMTMQALTSASRALCFATALAADFGRDDPLMRARADLLTPVAKAFSTDAGSEVASLGVQVHGGMGFIEETGAAQILRDVRIAAIYEGTNGIQAIDLVTRKLSLEDGRVIASFISELETIAGRLRGGNRMDLGRLRERLEAALEDFSTATEWLLAAISSGRAAEALAGATPYLQLFGLTAGAALLARGVVADGGARRVAIARFMGERLLPETSALRLVITTGAEALV